MRGCSNGQANGNSHALRNESLGTADKKSQGVGNELNQTHIIPKYYYPSPKPTENL